MSAAVHQDEMVSLLTFESSNTWLLVVEINKSLLQEVNFAHMPTRATPSGPRVLVPTGLSL